MPGPAEVSDGGGDGPTGDVPDVTEAGLVLGRLLSRVVAPAVWCDVRHPAVIQWIFSQHELAARLGTSVVSILYIYYNVITH